MIRHRVENIDTEKIEIAINEKINYTRDKQNLEKEKIAKYYEGYRDALYDVANMLYCSNYEKDKEKEGE